MSDVLPPLNDMLAEFDSGKIPRSDTWHLLISGLYLNNDKVSEIEGWYNTVLDLTSVNQNLSSEIKLQHDQIEIWYGEVDSWQQQVSQNTTLSEQYKDDAQASSISAGHSENAAAGSASTATDQAMEAEASAVKAKASETAAADSAIAGKASELAAESSKTQAGVSASNAASSEAIAIQAADTAGGSALDSQASASQANGSKELAANSATIATQQASLSTSEAKRAKLEADRAKSEADSVTVKEAPKDGKQYVRQNGQWIEVETDNEWRPGDIKMIAGSESDIQPGWQLCNGVGQTSNGIRVPDLMDRMVIGSGKSYALGDTGGSLSVTTSETGNHNHTITVANTTLTRSNIPAVPKFNRIHTTTGSQSGYITVPENGWSTGVQVDGHSTSGSYGPRFENVLIGSNGAHSHSASCNQTGGHTHTVSTLSPYYALAFVIKL